LTADELYMQRALELAALGTGQVSPNPLVGCVIVKDGKIIGEGWHKKYGEAHAEVNAINSVYDKEQLHGSTLYVTLEPCAHHGKTPPCADLIVKYKFERVVVSTADPNPLVAGKGIKKIREAGIIVEEGLLNEQGRELNIRFFTFMEKKRPYIILKWAQTADGFIATEDYQSKWISNEISRILVHKWRAEEDGVMVGANTAFYDNPQLNVREWAGQNPVRIVIDRGLRLSKELHLFDGTQPTLCYNQVMEGEEGMVTYIKITNLPSVVADLYDRKIQSVLIEGGAILLNKAIGFGLWDEARIVTGNKIFGTGFKAPELPKGASYKRHSIRDDEWLIVKNNSNK